MGVGHLKDEKEVVVLTKDQWKLLKIALGCRIHDVKGTIEKYKLSRGSLNHEMLSELEFIAEELEKQLD